MKTEDIIEGLQARCAVGACNDYLLVNALSRLRTLQSKAKQRDELLAALKFAKDMMIANDLNYGNMPRTLEVIDEAIAKAKGEK